ncbi:uncharacterized protein LOC124185889 isoform X1 [Neodiprion fabricii]|uniref:uncharacterized protein LOC124185889 isoform X1 n=1 Tax=Neodiprion fabricii TaxID=2872261 RepID=UPI001ED94E66|nr:uncharacterized protein LOC124185889 isoform X1 [Neodiprion fabricii]XP_046433099.1 uncharacterized protein LOC124185889 isoform X1 [Neodiprion fabricii]
MSYAGNPDSAPTGFSPAPPPPPPPPPVPGQAPALRINTAEAPRPRRPQNNSNDAYEPPAAIQNAMMTKDKKPFTYTPGMGGKLDLSQIRSPRMARRVAKNANDEGIEGPPKSALEPKPTTPSAGPNLYVQPQVAVPVFPANIPTQPSTVNRTPASTHVNRVPSNASNNGRNEGKVTPITIVPSLPSSPQTPTSPPQVTLAKAPTPWLQNKPKQQEDLPEWAKRANANKPIEVTIESSIASPVTQQSPPPSNPQPQFAQRQVPASQPRQQDRVIPIRIEDRPSVFSVKNEPGHHQLKQPPNQQQRWGQPQAQQQQQIPQQGGTRIIPIMVDDDNQSQGRTIPVEVHGPKVVIQRGPPGVANQQEPGPVQSRSFRVLQKITDTDSDTDVDGNSEQIRKLQLTEDDKVLMNKFKEQVDGETYLHQEEDPRYRGAAIPSRAFRFLQTMTDSGEVPSTSNAPRPSSAINKKQNRNSKSFEEAQANLPPSEQQVQEPKKYMGSAIPSRSFRMLQAMTSPENIAPQENRQQDFTSRTENSVTGNQQSGLFFPNCPSPYWNPEGGWWGYYPVQYATPPPPPSPQNATTNNPMQPINVAYNPYAYCGYGADGNSYAYFHPAIYDQNYAQAYAQSYANQGHAEGQADAETSQVQVQAQAHCQPPVDRRAYAVHGYMPMPQVYSAGSANCRPQTYNADLSYRDGVEETAEDRSEAKLTKGGKAERKELEYLTVPKWTCAKSRPTNHRESTSLKPVGRRGADKDASGCARETGNEDSESDSSDSENSEDSEDSGSTTSSTSSDSGSESEYLAYTNEPMTKETVKSPSQEKDCLQSLSATTISEDGFEHSSSRLSSDKLSCSDCDSDADDEYQIESLNNDCILPHQLSVIYEDFEQTETESESRKLESVEEAANDEPPDDTDSTTISVSLPLRFKFSVSENNEDVTTVVVGDGVTVKSGRTGDSQEWISRSRSEPDESNDVHVNLTIKKSDTTSVDFTLKKQKESQNESFDTEFTLVDEQTRIDLRETSDESVTAVEMDGKANVEGEADCKRVDCNDNVETELTIRRKKTDVTRHVWKKDLDLEAVKDLETVVQSEEPREDTEREYTVRNLTSNSAGCGFDAEFEETTSTAAIEEDNVHKETIEQKSLRIKERDSVRTEFAVKKVRAVRDLVEEADSEKVEQQDGNSRSAMAKQRLLTVQNSREETDDEDSGVTSDMSRLISEGDTDSECASIRRMNKYQRTQTHSRLFKLLNDDAILAEEDSSEECYSPARREHLSLPLKTNVFNYDENYYSNYSSGITSPDYSPLCEHSWRRIHEGRSLESENSSSVTTPNECVDVIGEALGYGMFPVVDKPPPTDDPYFQTWKKVVSPVEFDYDILPSIAFKKLKKLDNGFAISQSKTHRINVLCPRIKSSKNVPQALQIQSPRNLVTAASSIPFLSTTSSLKNGHC